MGTKRLTSVFTDDMEHCFYTGNAPVERHHIFGGSRKEASERRGFIVPLSPQFHPNGAHVCQAAAIIDDCLKKMAQKYYEEHYGTREEFREEFGKSYL